MDIEKAIESIWENARRGIHYPVEWHGKFTLANAYQVQLGILGRYLAEGESQAGWKVGVTSKAMQEQQGVNEPVFGFLLTSGNRSSGVIFQNQSLIKPGFENELCLTLGDRLRGPGVTIEQARAAIASVAPALEIIERRGKFGDLPLSLADNAQQKAFVTGAPTSPLDPAFDLSATTLEVFVDGELADQAAATAVMGNPAASIAWLANKLAEFNLALEAGMRVMSGSFTRQHPVDAPARVEARFSPFGSVTAQFV